MKKILFGINLSIVFMTLFLVSCNKDEANWLQASKTTGIKRGEPIVFTFTQVPSGVPITWGVEPSAKAQVTVVGNTASILFSKAGNFTVMANIGPQVAMSRVTVDTTVFPPTGGGGATIVPLTGDKINITLSKIDTGSNSGLLLSAISNNSYNCFNNYLVSNLTSSGADYQLNYSGVAIPSASECISGQKKATGFTFLYPILNGSHAFSIVVNSIIYTGSITKTGSNYSITWPNTSVVNILPLTL